MIWGIIIIALIGAIIEFAITSKAQKTANRVIENRKIKQINEDSDRLEQEWNIRVSQLHIDLNKAVCVKYYPCYYEDCSTNSYYYEYLWPVEGAIASFTSFKAGVNWRFTRSPLEWSIDYLELKNIIGIYKRNDVCIIQCDDDSNLGYSIYEYEKIKNVYNEAKKMTS